MGNFFTKWLRIIFDPVFRIHVSTSFSLISGLLKPSSTHGQLINLIRILLVIRQSAEEKSEKDETNKPLSHPGHNVCVPLKKMRVISHSANKD